MAPGKFRDFYDRRDVRTLLARCNTLRIRIQNSPNPPDEWLEEFLSKQGQLLALRAEFSDLPIFQRGLKGDAPLAATPKVTLDLLRRRERGIGTPADYLLARRRAALLRRGWTAEELEGRNIQELWAAEQAEELRYRLEKPARCTMGRPSAGVPPAVVEAIKVWTPQPLRWD
jgi:hypothetical protein